MNDTLERTDLEVIEGVDLEAVLKCEECGVPADWRLSMKCCGTNGYKCEQHMSEWRQHYDHQYLVGQLLGRRNMVRCGECGHVFGNVPYRDCVYENRIRGGE